MAGEAPGALARKLQLRPGMPAVLLAPPPELAALLAELPPAPDPGGPLPFVMGFASSRAQLDAVSQALLARDAGDALLWVGFPKQSSRRYRPGFNRDSGWEVLAAAGYETVRAVALDTDWSALRWRHSRWVGRPGGQAHGLTSAA